MSTKKSVNRTLILSKENFSKFTKVNLGNISEFYRDVAIFIVYSIKGNEHELIHTFESRKRCKKGENICHYLFDGSIKEFKYNRSKDESEADYNEYMDNFLPYLKEQIKLNRLYAIKL